VRPLPVLRGAFAKRTIARLDSKQILPGNGGCDDATGEASFEVEACNQSRRTGVGCCWFDFLASGRRIRSGVADRGRAANAELCAYTSAHARRRRNRRRQSRHVPSVRQGEHGSRERRRADGLGLQMRWLQRLRRLQRLQGLPRLRRLWRLRRILLRVLGSLPSLLTQRSFQTH
jgi:hypothetical protein